MKVELHLLQNFAPSNLNRDDTGAPKDCEFGGVRRARVSSQCLKRAVRQAFVQHELFEGDEQLLAVRTKRLVEHVTAELVALGHHEEQARSLVAFALGGVKLKVDQEDWKTQYLLFLPKRAIQQLSAMMHEHWSELTNVASSKADEPKEKPPKKADKSPSKKADKSSSKDAVPKALANKLETILKDISRTPDLALFGRMIADNPDWNADAACQVAHAISTNRVSMEFDFYTAVDDLRSADTQGSDMMGTVVFNSACFYRYSCLDVAALRRNLAGDDRDDVEQLLKKTLNAYLRATALAIPTGKQNSMAALNLPSYLLASVRSEGAPQSLANAFVAPVRARPESDLITESIRALEQYLDQSLKLWGANGLQLFSCSDREVASSSGPKRLSDFDAFVAAVTQAATEG